MAALPGDEDFVVSDDGSLHEAIVAFRALRPLVLRVDLARREADELSELTSAVRSAQQAVELMLVEIGMAADAQAQRSQGRGAHATLLGDGSVVRGRTARCEVDRSRLAAEFDKVARALRNGRIGAAQVDAITRAASRLESEERQRLNTDAIVAAAASQPVDVFARTVHREVDRLHGDHGLGETKTNQARSRWKHWFDDRTGMGHVHGEFDAERYEAIIGSVEAELTRLANHGGVNKNANVAAEAAFRLLTGSPSGRPSVGRPHLNVVIDWETFAHGPHKQTLSETDGGRRLPPESVARLACDAVVQRVVLDNRGLPINVGRKHRTATDAQWQAVRAIYRTCAWDGCDHPLARCQLHHLHEWTDGGLTDLCNLVPLCSRHHHAVHEGGWTIKLHATDRRLDIHSPDGRLQATTRPDRTAIPEGPVRPRSRSSPGPRSRRRRQPAQPAAP